MHNSGVGAVLADQDRQLEPEVRSSGWGKARTVDRFPAQVARRQQEG
jgi:hypothetical protein